MDRDPAHKPKLAFPNWSSKAEENKYLRGANGNWEKAIRQYYADKAGTSTNDNLNNAYEAGKKIFSGPEGSLRKKDVELAIKDKIIPKADDLAKRKADTDSNLRREIEASYGVPLPPKPIAESTPKKNNPNMAGTSNDDTQPMMEGLDFGPEVPDPTAQIENTGNTTTATEFALVKTLGPPMASSGGGSVHKTYRKRQQFFVQLSDAAANDPKFQFIQNKTGIAMSNGWLIMPYANTACYMDESEVAKLHMMNMKWRVKGGSIKMSNIQMVTAFVSGTSTPQLNQNFGGIPWESVIMDAKELGPHYIGAHDQSYMTYSDAKDAFNSPHVCNLFPFYLNQIAVDSYSKKWADVEPKVAGYGLVGKIKNLSAYSHVSMGQPPDSTFTFKVPKKQWNNTGIYRPEGYRVSAIDDQYTLAQSEIRSLPTWGNFDGNAMAASRSNYLECAVPGARSTTINHPGGTVDSAGYFGHCGFLKANNAPICKFHWGQAFMNDQNSWGPMQGNGTPPSEKVWCFRMRVPPTIEGAPPNLLATFWLETELETEEYPITNDTAFDGYRNFYFTQSNDYSRPEVMFPPDYKDYNDSIVNGFQGLTKMARWNNNNFQAATDEPRESWIYGISDCNLDDVPYSEIPGPQMNMGQTGLFGARRTGAHDMFGNNTGNASVRNGSTNIYGVAGY